jgi:hypothetical protein
MFHTYARGCDGKIVDTGRAQFLVAKELLRGSIDWLATNRQRHRAP